MSFRQYGDNPDYADPQSQDYLKGDNSPPGHQVEVDQQGGDPRERGSRQDDISALREGGQTNYEGLAKYGEAPFDPYTQFQGYRRGNLDTTIYTVPLATQEDRALICYDYGQQVYNANLDAGGNLLDNQAFRVETDWVWLLDRMAAFGSGFTAGSIKLYDGNTGDDSFCYNIQAGNAVNGGVSSISAPAAMTPGTPLGVKATGAGNNGTISIGIWYRRAKWIWVPETFIQEDALSRETEQQES